MRLAETFYMLSHNPDNYRTSIPNSSVGSRMILDDGDDEVHNRLVKYGSACGFLTSESSDLICSKKRKSSRIAN